MASFERLKVIDKKGSLVSERFDKNPTGCRVVQLEARLLQYRAVFTDMAKSSPVFQLGFLVISQQDQATVKIETLFQDLDDFVDDLVYGCLQTDGMTYFAGQHGIVIVCIQLVNELIPGFIQMAGAGGHLFQCRPYS